MSRRGSGAIHVLGDKQLLKKLEQLEKQAARRALRKGINAGVAVLVKAVKEETPVDEGLLKKATDRKIIGRRPTYMRGIVGVNVDKLGAEEARPTNLDSLINFGHVTPDGIFVPPNPYLTRARNRAMADAVARFTERLSAEIQKAASK